MPVQQHEEQQQSPQPAISKPTHIDSNNNKNSGSQSTSTNKPAKNVIGTVKWYNVKKGYGFIQVDENPSNDVFVHMTALVHPKPAHCITKSLADGEHVAFDIIESLDKRMNSMKLEAANVTAADGGPPIGSKYAERKFRDERRSEAIQKSGGNNNNNASADATSGAEGDKAHDETGDSAGAGRKTRQRTSGRRKFYRKRKTSGNGNTPQTPGDEQTPAAGGDEHTATDSPQQPKQTKPRNRRRRQPRAPAAAGADAGAADSAPAAPVVLADAQ